MRHLRVAILMFAGMAYAASVASAFAAQVPAPPRWSLVEEMRIDAQRADLVTFLNLAVGPRSEIALPQSQDRKVAIFDSTGARIGTAGRSGAGPGEFERPVRELGWIGDTLWIANTGSTRLPIFSRNGRLIRELAVGTPPVGMPGMREGRAVFVPQIPRVDVLTRGGAIVTNTTGYRPDGGRCPCVFNLAPDGSVRNLIGSDPPDIDTTLSARTGGAAVPPFAWITQRDAAPDGSRVAWLFATRADRDARRFRVVVLGQRGDTIFNRTYGFEAIRIPQPLVDSIVTVRARQSSSAAALQTELRQSAPPFYMPWVAMGVYQGIRVGLDYSIWIGLRATAEGNTWLALDPIGNPVGRIVLPSSMLLMEASRDRLWASEDNADGLRSVVRFRISR